MCLRFIFVGAAKTARVEGLPNRQQVTADPDAEEVGRQIPIYQEEAPIFEDEGDKEHGLDGPAHFDATTGEPTHVMAFVHQIEQHIEEDPQQGDVQTDAVEEETLQEPAVVSVEARASSSSPQPAGTEIPREDNNVLVQEPVVVAVPAVAVNAAYPVVLCRESGREINGDEDDNIRSYKYHMKIRK